MADERPGLTTDPAFFGHGWLLLTHINNLYACRELIGGLLQNDSPALLDVAARVRSKIAKRLSSMANEPQSLTADDRSSMQQLMQNLEPEASALKGPTTQAGQAAVAALLDAVYGPGTAPTDALLNTVAFGPLHKAEVLAQAAAAVLKRCLRASNCFTLMVLARGAGCQPLAEAALLFALPNFAQCLQRDAAGFCRLDDACLLQLLCNRHLQAGSRSEVLDGVAMWVRAAPAIRTRLLPSLLESAADVERVEARLRAPKAAPLQVQVQVQAQPQVQPQPQPQPQPQVEEGSAECAVVAAPEACARHCRLTRQDSRAALLAH